MASTLNAESDETLLTLLAHGSHAAFETLVNRHAKRFYATAYYLALSREDAEDVVQDAFLKLWRQPQIWDATKGAKFTTWFHRIVINATLDVKRKRRTRMEPLDAAGEIVDDGPHPDETIAAAAQQRLIDEAIKRLPEHQRLALTLCFYQGLSNEEAARVMGIHIKALQSLIMRAKTGLKSILNVEQPAEAQPAARKRTTP